MAFNIGPVVIREGTENDPIVELVITPYGDSAQPTPSPEGFKSSNVVCRGKATVGAKSSSA